MIKYCLDKWSKNSGKLRTFFEKSDYLGEYSYEDLLMFTIRYVLNDTDNLEDFENWDYTKIRKIDDGQYQGHLIFVFPRCVYQPAEYDYMITYIGYGSCSICDTLQGIQTELEEEYADRKECINDLMMVCRDMMVHMLVPYNYGWRYKKEYEQIEM